MKGKMVEEDLPEWWESVPQEVRDEFDASYERSVAGGLDLLTRARALIVDWRDNPETSILSRIEDEEFTFAMSSILTKIGVNVLDNDWIVPYTEIIMAVTVEKLKS